MHAQSHLSKRRFRLARHHLDTRGFDKKNRNWSFFRLDRRLRRLQVSAWASCSQVACGLLFRLPEVLAADACGRSAAGTQKQKLLARATETRPALAGCYYRWSAARIEFVDSSY